MCQFLDYSCDTVIWSDSHICDHIKCHSHRCHQLSKQQCKDTQWQIHLNLHYIIRYITNKVCNVSDKNAKKVIKSMFKNVADGKDVVVTFQN